MVVSITNVAETVVLEMEAAAARVAVAARASDDGRVTGNYTRLRSTREISWSHGMTSRCPCYYHTRLTAMKVEGGCSSLGGASPPWSEGGGSSIMLMYTRWSHGMTSRRP